MINYNNPPIHQIQQGCVRAAIFENVSDESRYFVLFTRLREECGVWKRAVGYRPSDLAQLDLLVLETADWLREREEQEERTSFPAALTGREGM